MPHPITAIKEIYQLLPKEAKIVSSCSTGYGEALVKAALMLDDGEVETVAHFTAAAFFDPDVDWHPGHRRPGYEMYPDQKITPWTASS